MYFTYFLIQSDNVLIYSVQGILVNIILFRQPGYHYPAMSFGYGVGDIVAISGLALKVYTAYKDAPGDYQHIADEVNSLHIIIKKAAQHFDRSTLSDNDWQEGQEVLKGCKNVLEELDSLIVKYNSLASASTGQVLQRIKLGAEDIAALRARLTSNTTLLSSFIQRFDTPAITIEYYADISLPQLRLA